MRFALIAKVLGLLLMLFSVSMLPPLGVSLWFGDHEVWSFLITFVVTFSSGFLIWYPVHHLHQELRTRDGFLVTVLFWLVLALFGAIPFSLSNATELGVVDAYFESLSGLTTTGATILVGLDSLPKSLLYYRQQLHWLGGIGIVVIAVAILPMLGIGGMQLYKAEAPGPVKDAKITPRITGTAKALFLVYVLLTLACGLAYWLAGMPLFDAVGHAYATIAIGGFSMHDASMGHYQNPTILLICMVFMLLAGLNFALHFLAWQQRSIRHYWQDPECRFYALLILFGIVIVVSYLWWSSFYNAQDSLLHGTFALIASLTTTGFFTSDRASWPPFAAYFVFMFAFIGACAGSSCGGLKVIRVLLIAKQGIREIKRLIHPSALMPLKLGTRTVPNMVVEAVWGFFAVYLLVYLVLCILLLSTGLDFETAFSAVGACLNNLGPGLGGVSSHYRDIGTASKWILCIAMLLGRLEIFTLLVLFTPMFWRR